jgi:hypothetical protein
MRDEEPDGNAKYAYLCAIPSGELSSGLRSLRQPRSPVKRQEAQSNLAQGFGPIREKVSRNHFPGATKPYEVVPILGSEPVTVCGPEVLGTVDPGAAAKDAVLSFVRPLWDLAG